MFKTRVISALIGIILLIIVSLSGPLVFGAAVFLLALVGLHEFYGAMDKAGYHPAAPIGYAAGFYILFIPLYTSLNGLLNTTDFNMLLPLGSFFILAVLFSILIFNYGKFNITDLSVTILGIFYIVFLFSFLPMTRNLEDGFYYIWFIFIGAWATDTFAYFVGVKLGKTKILPLVSPKKSMEGSVGGIVGCIAITVLYGIYLNNGKLGEEIELYHLFVLGGINGIVSQLGDWSASAMKRYTKIKDYGRIMPGHGGVLDRFDSILFISPVVYFYITLIIL